MFLRHASSPLEKTIWNWERDVTNALKDSRMEEDLLHMFHRLQLSSGRAKNRKDQNSSSGIKSPDLAAASSLASVA